MCGSTHLFAVLHPQSGAMEGKPLKTFYTQLVLMPNVLHYAQYVLLALGCILLLIPIIHQLRSQVGSGQSEARAEWPIACLPGEGGAQMGSPGHPSSRPRRHSQPRAHLGQWSHVSAWGRGAVTACLPLSHPTMSLFCWSWEAWGLSLGRAASGLRVMRPGT